MAGWPGCWLNHWNNKCSSYVVGNAWRTEQRRTGVNPLGRSPMTVIIACLAIVVAPLRIETATVCRCELTHCNQHCCDAESQLSHGGFLKVRNDGARRSSGLQGHKRGGRGAISWDICPRWLSDLSPRESAGSVRRDS